MKTTQILTNGIAHFSTVLLLCASGLNAQDETIQDQTYEEWVQQIVDGDVSAQAEEWIEALDAQDDEVPEMTYVPPPVYPDMVYHPPAEPPQTINYSQRARITYGYRTADLDLDPWSATSGQWVPNGDIILDQTASWENTSYDTILPEGWMWWGELNIIETGEGVNYQQLDPDTVFLFYYMYYDWERTAVDGSTVS
ncbi:MAG: hypothetical protein JNM65_10460 [Verrucomicrobiaceae bacterium]|nr:hypothetical protein [Verrucomicrobiaceae bacterium]